MFSVIESPLYGPFIELCLTVLPLEPSKRPSLVPSPFLLLLLHSFFGISTSDFFRIFHQTLISQMLFPTIDDLVRMSCELSSSILGSGWSVKLPCPVWWQSSVSLSEPLPAFSGPRRTCLCSWGIQMCVSLSLRFYQRHRSRWRSHSVPFKTSAHVR